MKKFICIFLVTLLIIILYFLKPFISDIQDGLFRSTPESLKFEAVIKENQMDITYKWTKRKEHYTYFNFILVKYNQDEIQLSKELHQEIDYKSFLTYLNYYEDLSWEGEKDEIIIQIPQESLSGNIIIPLEMKKRENINVNLYYFHIISQPMDIYRGWIKSINDILVEIY